MDRGGDIVNVPRYNEIIDMLDDDSHNFYLSDVANKLAVSLKPWSEIERSAININVESISIHELEILNKKLWKDFNVLSRSKKARRRMFIASLIFNEKLDGNSGSNLIIEAIFAGINEEFIFDLFKSSL